MHMSYAVLIVDDENMPRKILRDFLPWSDLGVGRIYEADDGESALKIAKEKKPDIIISDIKMPRMNGMALAEAVRSALPSCKFIFLSGYSDKEYLKGAIKLKAASYVEKPIDPKEISGVLSEIIKELDAQPPKDMQRYFFRGREDDGSLLNSDVYQKQDAWFTDFGDLLRHKNRCGADAALSRLYNEIRVCEGTDPESIRQIYCQITFLFISCAESHNITAITKQSDASLYTLAKLETLRELRSFIKQLSCAYFDAFDSSADDLPARVNRYVEKHYADPGLSVQAMAQSLGFTYTYLCTAYKKECSKTINQHITQLRLEHARELLRTTSLKLHEVAQAAGYTDAKYFTKLFTKETGLSPKQYRERHSNEA